MYSAAALAALLMESGPLPDPSEPLQAPCGAVLESSPLGPMFAPCADPDSCIDCTMVGETLTALFGPPIVVARVSGRWPREV